MENSLYYRELKCYAKADESLLREIGIKEYIDLTLLPGKKMKEEFRAYILYRGTVVSLSTIQAEKTIYKHVEDVNYDDITDFKTKLQELIQADQRKTVTYELLSATGPSNNPVFEMAVKMDDMILGTGIGSSKKRAEQQAAKDALNKLAK